jgi:hypothetical protein
VHPAQPNSTAAWNPACKTCAYFSTSTPFLPIFARQRDHVRNHSPNDRAALFAGLSQRTEEQDP